MSQPIKIVSLKRTSSTVKLQISILDEELVLPLHVAHELGLKEDLIFTASQLQRLESEAEIFRCDRQLAHMLAFRAHSVGEARAKLKRKKYSTEIIDKTINDYKRKGLLDDARYAFRNGINLVERKPCGKSYLVAFLQRKMIDRNLAESTAEAVLCSHSPVSLATASLKKRWRQFSQFELEVARKKSYNYLSRRGFGYNAAKQAFEQLIESAQREDED